MLPSALYAVLSILRRPLAFLWAFLAVFDGFLPAGVLGIPFSTCRFFFFRAALSCLNSGIDRRRLAIAPPGAWNIEKGGQIMLRWLCCQGVAARSARWRRSRNRLSALSESKAGSTLSSMIQSERSEKALSSRSMARRRLP